jgi:iduronate 2-sulfatase
MTFQVPAISHGLSRVVLIGAAILVGWRGPSVVKAAASTAPRNVLFIVVDDLNVALGCYGNAEVKSPNIDRLAARGVRFDRSYCQYPLCNPSRVSFLTGRRPETTGVYVLSTPARTAVPNGVMLPQFFREHGYFTGGAGKVFHSVRTSDAKSWDFYEDGDGNDDQEKAAIKSRYGGGDGRPAWQAIDGDGSQMRDGVNARTIRRLMREQKAAGKPFFLAAGFHKPHLPWTAPKRFFELYPDGNVSVPSEPALRDVPPIALQTELSGFEQPSSRAEAMRAYYACVSATDHQIGLLLNELDQLGLWGSTVVVLLGDNGFHLGDHGGLWAKLSAFDAATRVPLIFAGAGVPAGRVVRSPVELLDIYPTLAELCSGAIPPELEGRSLVGAMQSRDEETARVARSMVYHYDPAARRDVMSRTLVASTWRYTEWDGGAAGRELYWRADDPLEYRNRAADPARAGAVQAAQNELKKSPAPKPGPANRPRALAPGDQRVN